MHITPCLSAQTSPAGCHGQFVLFQSQQKRWSALPHVRNDPSTIIPTIRESSVPQWQAQLGRIGRESKSNQSQQPQRSPDSWAGERRTAGRFNRCLVFGRVAKQGWSVLLSRPFHGGSQAWAPSTIALFITPLLCTICDKEKSERGPPVWEWIDHTVVHSGHASVIDPVVMSCSLCVESR